MSLTPRTTAERKNVPTTLRGHEHGELPVDDPPPVEHPSEQYPSWRATAIFDLGPFTTRMY